MANKVEDLGEYRAKREEKAKREAAQELASDRIEKQFKGVDWDEVDRNLGLK